jgi:hypothetical protein
MCLEFLEKSKFEIATKPIVVFKNGEADGDWLYPQFVREFHYVRGKPTVKLVINQYTNRVEEGYHAWGSFLKSFKENDESHLFVIPVGATYIKGEYTKGYDTIAADQMVWIGSIWNPLNWIKAFNYK